MIPYSEASAPTSTLYYKGGGNHKENMMQEDWQDYSEEFIIEDIPLYAVPRTVQIRERSCKEFLPQGATGCWASSGGKCTSCSEVRGKAKMLLRALSGGKGIPCCTFCSPHVSDEVLRLWARPGGMRSWTYQEKGRFV